MYLQHYTERQVLSILTKWFIINVKIFEMRQPQLNNLPTAKFNGARKQKFIQAVKFKNIETAK